MKIKSWNVMGTDGEKTTLKTDDTLTLAFPGMVESTPATLAKAIAMTSLMRIEEYSHDSNERNKAKRAITIKENDAHARALGGSR